MTNRTAAELESLIKFYDLQIARCRRADPHSGLRGSELWYWSTLKSRVLGE